MFSFPDAKLVESALALLVMEVEGENWNKVLDQALPT